jgi:hypothetical protein
MMSCGLQAKHYNLSLALALGASATALGTGNVLE